MLAAAALLVAIDVRPGRADDRSVCGYGTVDEAIAACSRLLAVNLKDALAYAGRGIAYSHKGDYDRAISDFDQAVRLDPNAYVYAGRGVAYNGKGNYDRATSNLDQAIPLDPKFPTTYTVRSEAYEAKNDPDHAIADFGQALKLNPSLADARQGRERLQVLLTNRSNPGAQTSALAR
jgi:tetratricopeptide (TPR) repeat protein